MNDGKIPSSADGSIPRQSMHCKIVVMSKLTDSETSRQVACLQTALVSETDFFMGPWSECSKGVCFASRISEGATPFGSTRPGRYGTVAIDKKAQHNGSLRLRLV